MKSLIPEILLKEAVLLDLIPNTLCVSKLPVPRKEKVYSTKEEACRKGKMIKNPKNLKGKVKCKRQALIDQWSKLTLTMRKIIILDDSDLVVINQLGDSLPFIAYPMMKQSGFKDGAVREECEVCPTQSSEILILCKLWGWVGRDNISGFLCPNRSPIQWRLQGVKIKMSYDG